jgi:hypothetical protein
MGLFDAILNFVVTIGGLLKKKANISDYMLAFMANLPILLKLITEYKDVMTEEKVDEAIAAVREHMATVDLDRDMPPDIEAAFIEHVLGAAGIAVKHASKVPGYVIVKDDGVVNA